MAGHFKGWYWTGTSPLPWQVCQFRLVMQRHVGKGLTKSSTSLLEIRSRTARVLNHVSRICEEFH